MTKYKAGDVVVIRDDLLCDEYYKMESESGKGWVAVAEMVAMAGQTVTIEEYSSANAGYSIFEDEGYYFWTDSMFYDPVTDADWEPESIDILGIM